MSKLQTATFGGGCFWCTDAAFDELAGVEETTAGYAGGHVEHPSYEAVCAGTTGHAEVTRISYDPEEISYDELLRVFFTIHNPTTLNKQGPDVGEQYRSAIFYESEEQREVAAAFIDGLESENVYEDDIVTELEPLDTFYEAEEYHQNYYEKNPGDAYCQFNADPKIEKVREQFAEKVAAKPADD
ncbi:MAG: peptide-methionine (S)-S-oxide reductase MsrA [Halobacteriales archaeon]|nr:peptide-methionine (S)-S-oxide reductase MsrA [Halobacteriales archaeon]